MKPSPGRVLFLPHHFREPTDKGGLRSWHIVNQLEPVCPVVVVVPGVDTLTGERSARLPRFWPWSSERRSANVEIIRVNALRNDRSSKLRRALYYLSFSSLQFLRGVLLPRVRAVLTTSMPVSTMLLGWLIARLRGAAFVIDVRDLPTDLAIELGYFRGGSASRLLRRLEYFAYRRADRIVAVSQGMADLLVVGGVPAERIRVAPIGYDALEDEAREPSALVAALPLEGRFVVLYSGTMGYVVDVETVLESARLTLDREDILYLFVGDGQRLAEYEARSLRDGSHCVFTGRVAKYEVSEVCRRADVCVYPLIDGRVIAALLGNKIFDYMGAGRPTIYTGPPGDVARLIEAAGAGVCLPSGDAGALAATIRALSTDRARCERMGAAARCFVIDGLTAPQTTRAFAELIRDLAI
jgi:putative colanic acid biosynthesis glycosyltransferase WcaI